MGWKRKSARWEVDFPCQFVCNERSFDGKVTDLSTGGLFIDTGTPPRSGSTVQVLFALDRDGDFDLEGQVTHSGWYDEEGRTIQGFGLRFLALSIDTLHRLQQLLKHRVAVNSRFAKKKVSITPQAGETELEKRQSQQRILEFFEQSSEAFAVVSEEGRFLTFNTAFCELLGYEAHELSALTAPDLLTQRPVWKRFQAAMAVNGSVSDFEAPLRDEAGDELQCLISASMRVSSDGSVLGYRCHFRDVTRQRRLEDLEQRTARMAEMGRLAARMASDFADLLTSVMGSAQTMTVEEKDPARRTAELEKRLDSIIELTDEALTVAEDLQQLTGTRRVPPRPLKLDDEIGKAIQRLQRRWAQGGKIRFRSSLAATWPVAIAASQLQLILGNLASNSAAAMPQGGAIDIATRDVQIKEPLLGKGQRIAEGNYVKLTFADEGCGIAEDVRERIFEPFFTTRPKAQGMGLFTVWSMLHNLKGGIDLDSVTGQGTVLVLYLPAARTSESN